MSYLIIKQEWFSIRNQEGALRSTKEQLKYDKERSIIENKILTQLTMKQIVKLCKEVDKMLHP